MCSVHRVVCTEHRAVCSVQCIFLSLQVQVPGCCLLQYPSCLPLRPPVQWLQWSSVRTRDPQHRLWGLPRPLLQVRRVRHQAGRQRGHLLQQGGQAALQEVLLQVLYWCRYRCSTGAAPGAGACPGGWVRRRKAASPTRGPLLWLGRAWQRRRGTGIGVPGT